ncbi:conserved hypothetical protein [Tenacibaculum sp. 190524A02b]
MIKRMQLIKKTKNSGADAQHKNLSIQFSLDGFYFCITNSITKEAIVYTEYVFEKSIDSPELLLEKVIQIFKEDKDLQQDFDTVFAIHQNNLATLVPDEFFDKDNLKAYLSYTIKTLFTDFITYDSLEKIKANLVYIPYVNINNFIFQNFGEFEYKHHASILLDKILAHSKKHTLSTAFYVHVGKMLMDIIIIKDNELVLYNSFNYQSKEDFIYYILFVAEQLDLNPDTFTLLLSGAIEKDSDLYSITYKYVRNVQFIESTSTFFTNEDEFSNHSTYILL